jgi:hypothetical protein
VSAEPAADLDDFDADLLLRVFEAAFAALLPVTFDVFRCESAEPAADFAGLPADLLRRVLDAADAAFLPVFSLFFGIGFPHSS